MIKQHYLLLLLFILILPLLFVGVSNQHDWGDDFAQYLFQTRSFVEGQSVATVVNNVDYSPIVRGLGIIIITLHTLCLFWSSHSVAVGLVVRCICTIRLLPFSFLSVPASQPKTHTCTHIISSCLPL